MPALTSWNAGPARTAIVEFVEQARQTVPIEERVAVFDNDGTLWCEKPMPIQLDFLLRRLTAMATDDPTLRRRQPWKAAFERDYAWFGDALDRHYAGDDTDVRTLAGGLLTAYEDMSVEDFETRADEFLRTVTHPTLGRRYLHCAYVPMVELLGYLRENGFTNYIASGGGRDFMRPISEEIYGIPRERVIGSASALEYVGDGDGGTVRPWPRPTTSTTARKSQCASGAEPDADRCSPRATPTATWPCSTSPSRATVPTCACSFATTTPTVSSATRAAPRRRSRRPTRAAGRP